MNRLKLPKICELIMGQSPDSTSYNKSKEGLPFYQGNADFGPKYPTPTVWCSLPKKIARNNDILISVRAPIGDLNFANEECCIGRGLAALRIKDNSKYSKEYLFAFLKSIARELQRKGTGSTFTAIGKTVLEDLEINVPTLPEQQKIAHHLDTIQSAIDNKKKQLSELDELVKSKFNELIIENGKLKIESGEWKVEKLGNLCEIKSGGTPNRNNQEYWENGNIPWVKTTELRNEELSEIEEFITQKGLDESAAKIVPENTILLAMYGQGKTRGMTAFLTVPASTNQACACILPTKSTEILQRFIWYFLIMNYENIRNLAVGCNQLNLNSNLVKSIEIPVPPIELQNTFAEYVQKIDAAKSIVKKQLVDLKELLDSKMDEYFGE